MPRKTIHSSPIPAVRSTAHLTSIRPTLAAWEAVIVLEGPDLYERFVAAGKLKPCISKHRKVLYKKSDVLACAYELSEGNLPPPLPRSKPSEVETMPLPPEFAEAA